MEELAIKVENVSKNFRLPHEKHSTIKSMFTGLVKGRPFNRTYETQHALENINIEIKKGEFFGIVGRNGSGKSTLLKILAGIYQPTNGKVNVDGKLVPFIELGVGFNPELTGRENVYLNGALLGFSQHEVDAFYDEVVDFAELKKFMDQKLKNYSSGMQVRLAFSMAIRAKADILLIDEVLAVGDADFQRKCYDYFRSLKQQHKTVIFVTHDMNAVREYCNRGLLLQEGEVIFEGAPDKLAEAYLKNMNRATQQSEKQASKTKRWGEAQITYERVDINVSDEQIEISCILKAKKDIESCVAGIAIKGADGVAVMGSNSEIENLKLENIKKANKYKLVWKVPNLLKEGKYSVDAAVHGFGGLPVYDWHENAAWLEIKNHRNVPYPVAPKFAGKWTSIK